MLSSGAPFDTRIGSTSSLRAGAFGERLRELGNESPSLCAVHCSHERLGKMIKVTKEDIGLDTRPKPRNDFIRTLDKLHYRFRPFSCCARVAPDGSATIPRSGNDSSSRASSVHSVRRRWDAPPPAANRLLCTKMKKIFESFPFPISQTGARCRSAVLLQGSCPSSHCSCMSFRKRKELWNDDDEFFHLDS